MLIESGLLLATTKNLHQDWLYPRTCNLVVKTSMAIKHASRLHVARLTSRMSNATNVRYGLVFGRVIVNVPRRYRPAHLLLNDETPLAAWILVA